MRKKSVQELKVGDKSTFAKTLTDADLFAFAGICGDFNPLHINEEYAKTTRFGGRIVHGMLTASLIDYTLTDLIGLGGVHISQEIKFLAPVRLGDTVTVESVLKEVDYQTRRVVIESTLRTQDGTVCLTGTAVGKAPKHQDE